MTGQRQMRAIAIMAFGGVDRLTLMNRPVPVPDANEVLVRVRAAGVGLWDVKVRQGLFTYEGLTFPHILGWESAGVIEQVGADVSGFTAGDAVLGFELFGGHYADYVTIPADLIAAAPTCVDARQAAALPINGLTAYQAIYEAIGLRSGETFLITAAAGGTGIFAVQLAARLGAHVIATASSHNHHLLQRLGAEELIDYTRTNFVREIRNAHPQGVDAVLDCVGGKTAAQCLEVVRDGGRLVSIVDLEQVHPVRGIRVIMLYTRSDGKQLATLAKMVDAGLLSVHLDHAYPLPEARLAHERLEERHSRGKNVLNLD